MKSNKVGTTLKHPETINGNVKNLSKRMEMKDKGECHFYFKNLTLPLNTRVGTFLNSTSKAKLPFSAHQNTSFPPPLQFSKFFKTKYFLPMTRDFLAIFSKKSPKNRPKNRPDFLGDFFIKIVLMKKSRFIAILAIYRRFLEHWVLYVPGLKKNLVSVSTIEEKGYEVLFCDGQVLLFPRGSSITSAKVIGTRHESLYKFLF
jgi:hypothetical protein